MIVDLPTAKLHLRVDHADEDLTIGIYIGAAEARVSEYLNRTIYADATAQGTDTEGIVANDAIKAALLLIVGHLYANREDVISGPAAVALPKGSEFLLFPYRTNLGV